MIVTHFVAASNYTHISNEFSMFLRFVQFKNQVEKQWTNHKKTILEQYNENDKEKVPKRILTYSQEGPTICFFVADIATRSDIS